MMRSWPTSPFSAIYAEPSKNGLTRPKSVRGSGYKMINMGEIFAYNRIKNPPMELVLLNEAEKGKFAVKKGDLLFARQSLVAAGAGKCSIVLEAPELTTFESHLIRVRLDQCKVDPLFYYYYFSSYAGKGNIQSLVMQVAAAGIRGSELANLTVPNPPLPTQRKIASILSAYDDLIENNTRRIKVLEEMAQMIYREWFVKFRFPGYEKVKMVDSAVGKIPEGWEVKTFEEVSLNFDRQRKPLSSMQRANRKGPYPYYGAAKIFDYIDSYIFDGDYLLIAEDGSVVTPERKPVLQMASGKFWANNHTHVIKGKSPLSTVFLYLCLSDLDITGYITGAAQPKITQANLNRIPVLVPKSELLKSFDVIVSDLILQIKLFERKNLNLHKTRDLLLPKLISGVVDVEKIGIRGGEV